MTVKSWVLLVNFVEYNTVKIILTDFTFNYTMYFVESKATEIDEDQILNAINMHVSLRDKLYILCDDEKKKIIRMNYDKICKLSIDFMDINTTQIVLQNTDNITFNRLTQMLTF